MEVNEQNEKGFTIVELLASIIILSILIIGIFQMFVFSAKTATSNQTKLVTIHLAKATIERIKVDAGSYFPFDMVGETEIFNEGNCHYFAEINCDLFTMTVNDLNYEVEVEVSQDTNEELLDLINVVVTVTQLEKRLSSKVEGYVVDEN